VCVSLVCVMSWKIKFCWKRPPVISWTCWPSFIYIRWDGSPTIMDVWVDRKNFLCFPWTMNMVTSDHLLHIYYETGHQLSQMCELTEKFFLIFHGPWTWWPVTIFYIYKMRRVTNYRKCVSWQKNFFWFSMTHTNVMVFH